jgi:gag-polypeptide of LTR copia-type
METHLAPMEKLAEQFSSLRESLAEHLTVALLLNSLPKSYDILITALETRPVTDQTIEFVKN